VAPKIEPEIAFRLSLPVPAGLKDPVAVLAHVDWMAPAFEIVHCHYPHWRFTPPDSAADAALHFRLIVGQPVPLGPDLDKLARELRECRAALRCETEVMDIGTGANALDHPALALAFLADLLATQPFMPPLAAGEIVSTGTLTSALPVQPGETWSYDLAGIGLAPLEVTFTD
jgi:2-oxo-3-hexenedioate decarboxylase